MTYQRRTCRKWIDPHAFRDLRRSCGLTRKAAAEALDVTERTVQNWENGGARIPWMAFKLLRVLRGHALPGYQWDGWTMNRGTLYSPDGRAFEASDLYYLQLTFAQAKLWRQTYSRAGKAKMLATVVQFPARQQQATEERRTMIGGTR